MKTKKGSTRKMDTPLFDIAGIQSEADPRPRKHKNIIYLVCPSCKHERSGLLALADGRLMCSTCHRSKV